MRLSFSWGILSKTFCAKIKEGSLETIEEKNYQEWKGESDQDAYVYFAI